MQLTPEQMAIEDLRALASRLTRVVMDEADPANWPGGLTPVKDMDGGEMAARVNFKKGAALSVGLLQKVNDLIAAKSDMKAPIAAAAANEQDKADLGQELLQAEAAEIVKRIQKKYGSVRD